LDKSTDSYLHTCRSGIIATYTDYLIGEFKLAHPTLQSYTDYGTFISGPILRDVIAVGQAIVLISVMGAHIVDFGVAVNAITDHGTCTVVFTTIGSFLPSAFGFPRMFKNNNYIRFFWKLKGVSRL